MNSRSEQGRSGVTVPQVLLLGNLLVAREVMQRLRPFCAWQWHTVETVEEALRVHPPDATVVHGPTLGRRAVHHVQRLQAHGHRCVLLLPTSSAQTARTLQRAGHVAGVLEASASGIQMAVAISLVLEGATFFSHGNGQTDPAMLPRPSTLVYSLSTLYRYQAALAWEAFTATDRTILSHFFSSPADLVALAERASSSVRHDFSTRIYDFLTAVQQLYTGGRTERVNTRALAARVLIESGIYQLRERREGTPQYHLDKKNTTIGMNDMLELRRPNERAPSIGSVKKHANISKLRFSLSKWYWGTPSS